MTVETMAESFRLQAQAHSMIMDYWKRCPLMVRDLGRTLQEVAGLKHVGQTLEDGVIEPGSVWVSLSALCILQLRRLLQFGSGQSLQP